MFFLPCLAGIAQLLSVLLGGRLPGPLVRERDRERAHWFLLLYFLSVSLVISRL